MLVEDNNKISRIIYKILDLSISNGSSARGCNIINYIDIVIELLKG